MGGWVNRSEAAINVVIENKRKMLSRLGQNGMWSGSGARRSPGADDAPPAESGDLPTRAYRRNVVSPSSARKGKRLARGADRAAGKARREKAKAGP